MSGMAQRYCSELHREFQNLHAVWEPGNPLKLGDFGVMDGSVFRKKGNIEQKGVSVAIEPDDDSKYFSYKTAASTEVKFYANGEAPVGGTVNGRAKIEILFSNENSIFFNATDCRHDGVKDLEKIGDSLMDLLENDKWDMEYMVVTGILRARATTIVISATSGSSILLEAGANVPTIDLKDANIGLSIKHDNKLSFTAITDAKLAPLMELSRIQWTGIPRLSRRRFDPASVRLEENETSGKAKRKRDAMENQFILSLIHI